MRTNDRSGIKKRERVCCRKVPRRRKQEMRELKIVWNEGVRGRPKRGWNQDVRREPRRRIGTMGKS